MLEQLVTACPQSGSRLPRAAALTFSRTLPCSSSLRPLCQLLSKHLLRQPEKKKEQKRNRRSQDIALELLHSASYCSLIHMKMANWWKWHGLAAKPRQRNTTAPVSKVCPSPQINPAQLEADGLRSLTTRPQWCTVAWTDETTNCFQDGADLCLLSAFSVKQSAKARGDFLLFPEGFRLH